MRNYHNCSTSVVFGEIHMEGDPITFNPNNALGDGLPRVDWRLHEYHIARPNLPQAVGDALCNQDVSSQVKSREHTGPVHLYAPGEKHDQKYSHIPSSP